MTQQQVERAQCGFYAIAAGFSKVVSCVDGTHVWVSPPNAREQDFVNRKGYHSINVQVMCDHWHKFTNILARWPDSCHDSFILRSGYIWDEFEAVNLHGIVLGDSGYLCRPWLMYDPYFKPYNKWTTSL